MRIVASVIVLTLAITACKLSEPASQDRTAASGVYGMRTINGSALPFTLAANDTDGIEILSDTLRLTADGAYTGIERYRRTTSTSASATPVVKLPVDTVKGSWGIQGATISFKASSGDGSSAFFSGNTLTVSGGGLVSVYSK